MSQGAQSKPRSCDHCAKSCKHTPANECHEYDVHGDNYWLCDPCAKAGAPLLKAEPDFGQAPANETPTSQQSARQSDKDVGPQCLLVLGVIAHAGPDGLTREEIYQKANITNQAACARLKKLVDIGDVYTDGERFVPSTRRKQQIYRLSVYATMRAAA